MVCVVDPPTLISSVTTPSTCWFSDRLPFESVTSDTPVELNSTVMVSPEKLLFAGTGMYTTDEASAMSVLLKKMKCLLFLGFSTTSLFLVTIKYIPTYISKFGMMNVLNGRKNVLNGRLTHHFPRPGLGKGADSAAAFHRPNKKSSFPDYFFKPLRNQEVNNTYFNPNFS